jgi:hypothetical protein
MPGTTPFHFIVSFLVSVLFSLVMPGSPAQAGRRSSCVLLKQSAADFARA